MKKLIIASALLSLITLPVSADTPGYTNGKTDFDPSPRENCFEVEKNNSDYRFCSYNQEEKGIYEVKDDELDNDCDEFFGFLVDGECFVRNRDGRLFQINREN